jgi:hypothetical protein
MIDPFARIFAIATALLAFVANPARAIDNIEIMAPAAPGGGYDRTARALQSTIEKEGLGKNVTVVNVGGAGGAIGLAQFIRNKAGKSDAMVVGGFGMVASFATNKSPVTLADVTRWHGSPANTRSWWCRPIRRSSRSLTSSRSTRRRRARCRGRAARPAAMTTSWRR